MGSAVLLVDDLLPYPTVNRTPGMCRIRRFQTVIGDLVVFTELPDNPGMSVTNAATEVVLAGAARLGIVDLDSALWVEHYAPDSYSGEQPSAQKEEHRCARIHFDSDVRTLGNVRWTHMPNEIVEDMIGDVLWKG